MDTREFTTFMKTLTALTGDRYQLVIYSDGTGHLEVKDSDKTIFSFYNDNECDTEILEAIKRALPEIKD